MKKIALLLTTAALFASCTSNQTSTEATTDVVDSTATKHEEPAPKPKGYSIGDEAADFNLPSTSGTNVSLANYPEAKGFIVIFTCNHCPYAVAYEQRIVDLNKKYAALGYPVIAISPNDTTIVPEDGLEEMAKRAAEKGYTFPYALDVTQEIYRQYGATKTPHVYLLNKEEGKNIVRYIGAIDNNYEDPNDVTERYVESAVDALLAGTEIKVTETKAIGCGIKDKRNKKKGPKGNKRQEKH